MRNLNIMALLAATALVASPATAFADAKMVSSTPAANDTVTKPSRITLTFNEKLTGSTVKVELFMTGMVEGMSHDGSIDLGKMDHGYGAMTDHTPMKIAATSGLGKDGKSVTITPKRALAAGTYKVIWTAAGTDMHKTSETYSFTVK